MQESKKKWSVKGTKKNSKGQMTTITVTTENPAVIRNLLEMNPEDKKKAPRNSQKKPAKKPAVKALPKPKGKAGAKTNVKKGSKKK